MCDSCYEYDPDHEDDENRTPWSELPMPPEYKTMSFSFLQNMKVKELIEVLQTCNPDAIVTFDGMRELSAVYQPPFAKPPEVELS